jgi:tetratricopeptide (TPR) repeat protein
MRNAEVLFEDGVLAWQQGEYTTATALLEQSLSLCQDQGAQTGMLRSLHILGNVAYSQGNYAAAQARHQEVLQRCQEFDLPEGIASSLNNLGLVAMRQHDYQTSQTLLQESLRIYQDLAMEPNIVAVLHNLGTAAMQQNNSAGARAWFWQSLTRSHAAGNTVLMARSLAAIATLTARCGQHQSAVRLWGAAEALNESANAAYPSSDDPDNEHEIESARNVLGEETFAVAWQVGRVMPFERVREHALKAWANEQSGTVK